MSERKISKKSLRKFKNIKSGIESNYQRIIGNFFIAIIGKERVDQNYYF